MMFQPRRARSQSVSLPPTTTPVRRAGGRHSRRASGRRLYLELLEERILLAVTISDFTKTAYHNTPLQFTLADYADAFSDPGYSLTEIQILTLPSHGTLSLSGSTVTLNQFISVADIAGLSYSPDLNYSGEDLIGWNGADVLAWSDRTASVNITVQESAPTVRNVYMHVPVDTTTAFQAANFNVGFLDSDAGDNHDLQAIKIVSLPTLGALQLDGQAVSANQTITLDQIPNLAYVPTTDYTQSDSFTWTASDGSAFAATPATIHLTTTDVPVVYSFSKNGHHNTTLNFTESDFTGAFSASEGSLSNIEITSLPSHGTLTLDGTAVTLNQVLNLEDVANLAYSPDVNFSGSDVIGWNGSNGTMYANASADITLTIVQSAPTVGPVTKYVIVNTTTAFQASDFNAGFSDNDPGDHQNLQAVRIVSLPTVGTLLLGSDTFTAGQTLALAQLSELTYVPAVDYTGADSFTWTASDGSEFAVTPATITLTMDAKPTVSDAAHNIRHHTALNFVAANFTAAFQSAFDLALQQIQIVTLPEHGTLTLNGVAVSANQTITLSVLNSTSTGLSYLPAIDFTGADGFTWTGSDGVAFAETPANVTLNVSNSAPTVTAVTKTINKNVSTLFALTSFSSKFSDPDSGDSLQAVKILTLPANGRLTVNNLPVAVNQVIPSSEFSSFKYAPNGGYTGSDLFAWTGSDGSLFATASSTVTLTVANVAPTLSNISLTVSRNKKLTIKTSSFTAAFTDSNGDTLDHVIFSLPTYGVLSLAGVPVYNSQVIPLSQIGKLSYTPNRNFAGTDTFYWNASDGSTTGTAAAVSILVDGKAPTVAPVAKGVLANATGMAFSSWDFTNAFTEPNVGPILQSVTISTLPAHGTLTLSGTNVTAGQVIAATSIANLSYRPTSGYVGADSFKWKASDGVRTSSNTSKVYLTVASSTALVVKGNSVVIASGSTRTSSVDYTHFGPLSITTNIDNKFATRTYTITNNSASTINFTGGSGNMVQLTGSNRNDFTVLNSTVSSLAAGQSATFAVTFKPTKTGNRTAMVKIPVSTGTAYTFRIAGTGLNTFNNNDTSSSTYGLQWATIQAGKGDGAANGNVLTMNYTGYLLNGTRFDSSLNAGRTPFQFQLGADSVIKGWDPGLLGIQQGEKRVLVIPSSLGYGTSGSGSIPSNSTLVFIVECLSIGRPRLSVAVEGNTNNITYASDPSRLEGTVFPMMTANQSSLTLSFNLFDLGYQDATGDIMAQLFFTGLTTNWSAYLTGKDTSAFKLNFTGGNLFSVTFTKPATADVQTATVNILTNDPVHPMFTFDIQASSGHADLTPVLAATSFPVTVTSGDQTDLVIPLIVRNIGDSTSSGSSDIRIFAINTSTQQQTVLATLANQNFGGIAAHTSRALTLHASLPVGFAEGTYKLGVTLNPSQALVESAYTNNSASTTQTVDVVRGLADITGTLVSETLPASFLSNATFGGNVTLLITRQGEIPLPANQQVTVEIVAHNASSGQDIVLTTSGPLNVAGLAAGQNAQFTIPVKYTSGLAGGNYVLEARVLPVQALAESDTDNNLLTVGTAGQTLTFTSVAAVVDFTAALGTTNFAFAEVTSGDRATFTLPVIITNNGNIPSTGSSDITIFALNTSTEQQITVATFTNQNFGRLNPGASRTLTLTTTLPFGMTTGTYELGVTLNPSHALAEPNYTNNSATTTQTVDVIEGFPDLAGTLNSTTLASNIVGNQPIESSLVVTVANIGNVLLPANQQIRINVLAHNIALNQDTTLASSSTLSVASLASGGSMTFTIPISFAAGIAAGNYWLESQIVPVQSLVESGTSNNLIALNTASEHISIVAAAPSYDLSPTLGTTTFPDTTITSGDRTTLTLPLTVTNNGNITSTGSSDITIFAFNTSTEQQITLATLTGQNLGGLAPGASRTLTLTTTLPFGMTDGTYQLGVTLNPSHAITETTYSNNSATTTQTIAVTEGLPDLIGRLVSTTVPANLIGGKPVDSNLVVTVTNDGNVLLPANQQITITVLAHNTNTEADTVLTTTSALSVASLASGASLTFTVPIQLAAGLSAGDYILEAQVTPVQSLLENSTTNNLIAPATNQNFSVAVAAPIYDLVPTFRTTDLPAAVTSGDRTTLTLPITITNQGNITSNGSSDITLFALNTSTDEQITITTLTGQNLGGLAPGASRTMTLTTTLPFGFTSGTYELGVTLNPSHAITEPTYTNNSVTTTQTIDVTRGMPDLTGTLVSTTLKPAVIYFSSFSGNLIVTVENAGNVLLPANQTIKIDAVAHGTTTGLDRTLGSSTVSVGNLAAGDSRTFTISLNSPSGLPGDTFLLEARITPIPSLVQDNTANDLITTNTLGGNFTIVSDLRFYDLTGTLASTLPTALAANASISGAVNVTVLNNGNVTLASNQQITLTILAHNTDTLEDTTLATSSALSIASLGVGSTKTFTITVNNTAGLAAGSYVIEARIAPVQTLTENNTANNLVALTAAGAQVALTVT